MTKSNVKEFDEMTIEEKINERSGQLQVPYIRSKEEAFQVLKGKMDSANNDTDEDSSRRIRPIFWMGAAAATILLTLAIWVGFIHKPLTINVADRGQHTEIQLPDGSTVTLNAESKIAYNKKDFNTKRYLTLEGEAFFSVKKGQKFTIHTHFADIQILGTSFNVHARQNTFKVSCVTGKVKVYDQNSEVIIAPGESALLNNQQLFKFQDKNISKVDSWKIGEFFYENASLKTILNEIERQFNVTFVTSVPVDQLQYTGSFSNKKLTDALDIVCIPMGLTYELENNDKIQIKKKME